MTRCDSNKASPHEPMSPSEQSLRRPEPLPLVHALYEELTQTWQYVVADPISRRAVIIDPHLDNGPSSTTILTIAADRVLAVVRQNRYSVDRILHTHEPARHPTSAWYLRTQLLQATGVAPRVQIGRSMAAVQRVFKRKYSMNDGSQWKTDLDDTSFADGSVFQIGNLPVLVLHLMGGNFTFVIGQHIFAGASRFNLEARNIWNRLIGNLSDYHVYTSNDTAPERTAKLMSVVERDERDRMVGKKLVIRYAAELED